MKSIKIFFSILGLSSLVLFQSCKKYEDLSPIPDWETAVHGYAHYADGSPTGFTIGDDSDANKLNVNFQWISIDKLNTVTQIDFYILFNDDYTDSEGNPRVARLGGGDGIKFLTLTGGAVPANRVNTLVSIKQSDVYNLYKDVTFDYGDGAGAIKLFDQQDRADGHRFISGDSFSMRWELTTADGRKFTAWSPSICTEYETYHGDEANNGGFNCTVDWLAE